MCLREEGLRGGRLQKEGRGGKKKHLPTTCLRKEHVKENMRRGEEYLYLHYAAAKALPALNKCVERKRRKEEEGRKGYGRGRRSSERGGHLPASASHPMYLPASYALCLILCGGRWKAGVCIS